MPEKIEWLPILMTLGEETVARILEKSPDAKSAILAARENFQEARKEAAALRRKGHENDDV